MKNINAIKLNISWSDLGSWKEILLMYNKNLKKYLIKRILITDLGVNIQTYSLATIF